MMIYLLRICMFSDIITKLWNCLRNFKPIDKILFNNFISECEWKTNHAKCRKIGSGIYILWIECGGKLIEKATILHKFL